MPVDDTPLARELQTLQTIALAMAASVLVYCGVAFLLDGPSGEGADFLAPVLAAVGVGLLIVAPVAERQLKGAGAFDRPTIDAPAPAATDERRSRYRTAKIVGLALREAAAVVGLVIALLTGEDVWCYGLAAASLVAMALAWPSRSALESAAGRLPSPR